MPYNTAPSTNSSIEAQVAFKGGIELINAGKATTSVQNAVVNWLLARLVEKPAQAQPTQATQPTLNEWWLKYAILVLGEEKMLELAKKDNGKGDTAEEAAKSLSGIYLTNFQMHVALELSVNGIEAKRGKQNG